MTGFNLHRGLLAAAQRPPQGHWSDVVDRARRLLIVERINDQENLGTLFRSAAALGMDALLLSPDSCDPLYRRTVRVSMGAVLDLPFRIVDTWPNVLSDLGAAGWHVVAFTPATTAISLPECQSSLHGYERVAVMVGSEGDGLSAAALALATQHVRIPMTSHTDSLNVAMAASIGMYAVGGTGQ